MLPAINLYDDLFRKTHEINGVISNRNLPPEFIAVQLTVAQH